MFVSTANRPINQAMELNFQEISKSVTVPSSVGSSSQSSVPSNSWADNTNQVFTDLTTVKSDMPLDIGLMNYSRFQTNISDSQIVHITPKTVVMRSVSTMTDLSLLDLIVEGSISSSKDIGKNSGEIKIDTIVHQGSSSSSYCSNINVKSNASAMSEYLSRFNPSLNVKEFSAVIKEHSVAADIDVKVDRETIDKENGNLFQSCICPSEAQTGPLLYCCPQCPMVYPRKDSLDHHLLDHKPGLIQKLDPNVVDIKRKSVDQVKNEFSEERPFICELCNKSFKRSEHLKRHFIIHTGTKSHVCVQCGKAFSRKDHLSKHLQSHANRQAKSRKHESTLILPKVGVGNIMVPEDDK